MVGWFRDGDLRVAHQAIAPDHPLRGPQVNSKGLLASWSNVRKMTRSTRQSRTGQWGEDYVRAIVETGWGCIMQTIEGSRDRGIDATVFDMRNGHRTRFRFDLQIRTSEHYSRRPDGFAVTVSDEHRQMWSGSNLPVFLVCVDAGEGGETKAFWRMILSSDAQGGTIFVPRRNVFGPSSRGQVLTELRRTMVPLLRNLPPVAGRILGCPLHVGLRQAAKTWYRESLIPCKVESPDFGPVRFTWHGWRHITRRRRSRAKIFTSLLLLPSAASILRDARLPAGYRPLPTRQRGRFHYDRTLLFFERKVTFTNRSPALVRVTVKEFDKLPVNWRDRPPDAPERHREYTFYSIEEV